MGHSEIYSAVRRKKKRKNAAPTLTTAQTTLMTVNLTALSTDDLYAALGPVTIPASSSRATYTNWGRAFSCNPLVVFEPESELQCRMVIELARREGVALRAGGAGHSPSDIACTTGFMIRTTKLDKITEVLTSAYPPPSADSLQIDETQCLVTVQGGIILSRLHEQLHIHGLALSNVGSISDQSVAGIVATSTHGSGFAFPSNMSCQVVSLVLLLSDGSRVRCSRSPNEDPDLFLATLCGLGSTGFIMEVTIQCERAFKLKEMALNMPIDDFIENFPNIALSAEHVRCWWFGQRGVVRVSRCNRTKEVRDFPSLVGFMDDSSLFSRLSPPPPGSAASFLPTMSFNSCYTLAAFSPTSTPGRHALQVGS